MRLRLIVADSIYNGGIAEWFRTLRGRHELRPEIKAQGFA